VTPTRRTSIGLWAGAVGIAFLAFFAGVFVRSCLEQPTWKHLTGELWEWQTLITGGVALIAGVLAYRAGVQQARETRDASKAQLAAAAAKDRLQRQGLALGVAPELDFIEARHKRAIKMISEEWPKNDRRAGGNDTVAAFVREADIPVPPILDRSFGDLYLLGGAGHTIQQLMSYIVRYDHMLQKFASDIETGVTSTDLVTPARDFQRYLSALSDLLREAQQKLDPIHDEAAPPGKP